MKAEVILGFDPAPADQTALAALSDVVRRTIRALVDARVSIERLGRVGSVWDGPVGAPVVSVLRRYAQQLAQLEEALVVCHQAIDNWRDGSVSRQAEVADLVARVAELAGVDDDRRTRLMATARDISDTHERAAGALAAAFDELSGVVERQRRAGEGLADELDSALGALAAAVDEWVEAQAPQLLRTAAALGEVAGLTTVVTELVGITSLGRNPGEAAGVGQLVARSPASHRLVRALRHQWLDMAPDSLPEASFAGVGTGALAARLSLDPSQQRTGASGPPAAIDDATTAPA